jgi:DNA-binding response OmpR family regulator
MTNPVEHSSPLASLQTGLSVWVLEDDPLYLQLLEAILRPRYRLTFFKTLAELTSAVLTDKSEAEPLPDVLVADLILPDGRFLDLIQSTAWRARFTQPFLVASGVIDIEPMRQCLELGAVDYITKPFATSELIIKVERAIIEGRGRATAVIVGQHPVLDQLQCRVTFRGVSSPLLTLREMHLFLALNENFDRSVTKLALIHRVWSDTTVSEKAFTVHLAHLRRKLTDVGLQVMFVSGGSYRLSASAFVATSEAL